MPKRYKNLYQPMLNFEALHAAWKRSSKGRRNQLTVLRFENNLEGHLFKLLHELESESYQLSGYVEFYIHEPKFRRVARLRAFRDRIVQHAVYAQLEPVYEKIFIADSYACRKNKGTHAGADKAEQLMRKVRRVNGEAYALKCDIAGYFANIDQSVLISILARKIGDKRMLKLLKLIVFSAGENGKGLPLGNLTSQIFANIYLNELDQYVKHSIGAEHYVRYMDDFVLFHHDKNVLNRQWVSIEQFLKDELKLDLNRKTALFKISSVKGRALDFLGYRILPNRRMLRKSAIKSLRKKVNRLHAQYETNEITLPQVRQSLSSHLAHVRHASSSKIVESILHKPFRKSLTC